MSVVFNGSTRQIEVTDPSVFALDAGKELYSEWKRWQQASPNNAGYAPAFRTFGGDSTAPGQFAPKYYFLINQWTIYINNGNVVTVALNLYSDDFITPYIVAPGSGVSDRNSDAVNVNEEEVKNQSFTNNAITINTLGQGVPGTFYPTGTPPQPSDNYPDAYIIATTRKLNNYHLDGTLVLGMSDNIIDTNWIGDSPIKSIVVMTGQDTSKTTFEKIGITGTATPTDRCALQQCAVGNFINFCGVADNCGFNGNITLESADYGSIYFGDCKSVIAGTSKPIIDCNGTLSDIQFRGYIGGLEIQGFTGGGNMSVDMTGRLTLDATCTSGTIVVGGTVLLTDNSGPGCTVVKGSNVITALETINEGVKKASILIPHNTDI